MSATAACSEQTTVDLVGTGPAAPPDTTFESAGTPGFGLPDPRGHRVAIVRQQWSFQPTAVWHLHQSHRHCAFGSGTPPASPVPVQPPVEFHGLFPRRGELSGVTFEAHKGGQILDRTLGGTFSGFRADPAVRPASASHKNNPDNAPYTDVMELGTTNPTPVVPSSIASHGIPSVASRLRRTGPTGFLSGIPTFIQRGRDAPAIPIIHPTGIPSFALVALPVQPIRANDNDRAIHPLAPWFGKGGVEIRRRPPSRQASTGRSNRPRAVGPTCDVGTHADPGRSERRLVPVIAGIEASGLQHPIITGRSMPPGTAPDAVAVMAAAGPIADFNDSVVPFHVATESLVDLCSSEWAPVAIEIPPGRTFEAPTDGKVSIPLVVIRAGIQRGRSA